MAKIKAIGTSIAVKTHKIDFPVSREAFFASLSVSLSAYLCFLAKARARSARQSRV